MSRSFRAYVDTTKSANPITEKLEKLAFEIADLLGYQHRVVIDVWTDEPHTWPDVACITIRENSSVDTLTQFELQLISDHIDSFIQKNLKQYMHRGELADEQTKDGTQFWSWRLHAIPGIEPKNRDVFGRLKTSYMIKVDVRHE